MNPRAITGLAVATLSLGLVAASPANAATGEALLLGEYSATGTSSCLSAPGGFNDKFQANVPAGSFRSSTSSEEVWIFNGAGSVEVTGTGVGTSGVASAPSNPSTPGASGTTNSGTRKYTVGPGHVVTVTATNAKGANFAGTRAGQTLVVDKYVLQGHVSRDGATVTLATPAPAVETITLSNGDSFPRICHRSVVLLKL